MQRHTIIKIVNHSRSTALEQSVKNLLFGLNQFYAATTLALSSTVVYTRHLFSPREGFLTYQCNISKNIKSYRDETMMRIRQQEITEMLKQNKTNSWTPVGPTRARATDTNQHISEWVQDNSAQRQVGPGQLGPEKKRPKTTRPKSS